MILGSTSNICKIRVFNNFDNEIINYQKTFWELTQIIIDDFNINGNLEYYGNKF